MKPLLKAAILMSVVFGCTEEEKNVLDGTKWFKDIDGIEYLHFKSDMLDDYYYDVEGVCYELDQISYSVNGDKFIIQQGVNKVEFPFQINADTLMIIDIQDNDTVKFITSDFDPASLDICAAAKAGKKYLFKK
jgi:hypothetical protein